MDRRVALAHAFRSCRYAPHRSVPFAGAQLVPQHSTRRRLSAGSYTVTRSAAGSFALPLAVGLYGAPDCSEFPFEWLSISRLSAARQSSNQRSAACQAGFLLTCMVILIILDLSVAGGRGGC